MNQFSLVRFFALGLLMLFGYGYCQASCYLGVAQLALRLYDINTKKDYSLIANDYIEGSVEKRLVSNSQEIQVGCYLSDSLAVEAGYIPVMEFDSTSLLRIDASNIDAHGLPIDVKGIVDRLPTAKILRVGTGSARSLSVLWYWGDVSDFWRPFLRVKYIQAQAEGRGDISFPCQIDGKKGDCLVGVRTWRSAHAVAPNLGVSFRLGENLQGTIELPYYGPKFYGVAIGVKVGFW